MRAALTSAVMSRRRLVRFAGGAGLAATLSACSNGTVGGSGTGVPSHAPTRRFGEPLTVSGNSPTKPTCPPDRWHQWR